ncbi:BCAS3 microtubule associated cell migration factor-like [Artemia franciscana]|uniref:BCAS3 microtubule associated cell migration factor-like n=1 Tax=Artemia franciscana TaxID=6661 RepID=UPI0032D9CC40
MSDSPRHGRKSFGNLVKPQPPCEKTFMENMAGLINEVVPQPYGSPTLIDPKEEILWCKFEKIDHSQQQFAFTSEPEANGNNPPVILVLGYSKGYQVWAVLANGDAHEVVSYRQGKVRCLKLLPRPEKVADRVDPYSHRRPIIAICDSHGMETNLSLSAFTSVTFLSLKSGETIKTIKFKNPVCDIHANERVVVVTFPEKAAIFDGCTFEDRFVLTNCYLSPGLCLNPIALGHRWLAYAEKKLSAVHKSGGGFEGEGVQSYTATVIHAARSITKGLREMGGTLANSLIGHKSSSPPHPSAQAHPGIVTVVDLYKVRKGELSLVEEAEGIVAHFIAHSNEPITYLEFDNSGMLLFTADKQGRNFHIFKILPHPCSSVQSVVHHLYTLYRGDTSARIQDVSFTTDSRWVCVSTHRGTAHVFPITPYGGSISARTHTSQKVVNRLSRFQRSAGLDEKAPSSGSPIFSQSPSVSKLPEVQLFGANNPRLPPFPVPTVVTPLAQIRQPMSLSAPGRIPSAGSKSRHSSEDDLGLRVSICFAAPRNVPPQFATLPGTTVMGREKRQPVVDSLFVIVSNGILMEYCLEPKASATVPRDKVSEESPIDLDYHPISQWNLLRNSSWSDLPLPLSSTCLLILSPVKRPGDPNNLLVSTWDKGEEDMDSNLTESWLSQVEITTYAGPHRRLWMGPQFTFKTIQSGTGGESEPTEIELTTPPPTNTKSTPMNMPSDATFLFEDFRNSLPMVIETAGSAGSFEQSPRFMASKILEQRGSCSSVPRSSEVESQLQENIADAMLECGTVTLPPQGCVSVDVALGSIEDLSSSSLGSASQGSNPRLDTESRSSPSFSADGVFHAD